jgi:hypothetical protein
MQITLNPGYPDLIGRRFAWAGYGNGPSSYVVGGDQLFLPGYNNYIDAVFGPVYSVSGNYLVTPIPSNVGSRKTWYLKWYPAAQTDAGVPLSLGPLSAASTLSAVATKVGTVTVANTLSVGQFVYLSLFTQLAALNGTIVKVASATPTAFTFNLGSAANVTSGADTTGKFQVVQSSSNNLLQTYPTSSTITNSLATTSLLTMTCANSFQPGNFVYIDNLVNGAVANGVIVQVATSSATQFTAVWTGTSITTGADTGTATLLVTNGNAPIMADYSTNVTNSLSTASSAGTAGVISLSAVNGYYPGNIFVVKGLTAGAGFNGDVLVANSSTTGILLVSNHQTAAVSTAVDVGSLSMVMSGVPSNVGEVPPGTNLSAEQIQIGGFGGEC